jgi:pimeloyl-ACP methyl ester carboxylesterase
MSHSQTRPLAASWRARGRGVAPMCGSVCDAEQVINSNFWPGIESATLDLGGRDVHVLRSTRTALTGEPTLLVHGLAGSASTWIEIIDKLAAQTGGPVVAVDLPGFGRTPTLPDERLTVSRYVHFVTDVVDALGWERFVLHGNSMGGLIGTLLAARESERVTRLALVSPAYPPRVPVGIMVPSRATIGGMGPIALTSFASAMLTPIGLGESGLASTMTRQRDDRLIQIIYPSRAASNPAVLALMGRDISDPVIPPAERRRAVLSATKSIARHWTDTKHVWRAIDTLSQPTLLMGGLKDPLIPHRVLSAVLARRPDWKGHLLPGRRHALMLEEPETYLALVDAWTRSVAVPGVRS